MIEDPPILTVRAMKRPPRELVQALAGAQTGHIVDCMSGRGALDRRIKPLEARNATFCGPVLTAFAYPADNLAVFAALAEAAPGDVILVAHDGFQHTALTGDLLCGMLKNKGVAGLVTDGLVRDVAGIVGTGLPVFCSGVTPNSPAKTGPGTVGLPITIGGVHVESGDIVVSDPDGVVVVPQARAAEVVETLKAVRAAEAAFEAKVKGGLIMPDWLKEMMASTKVKRVK